MTKKFGKLALQLTPLCNLNCSYCYLENRKDSKLLDVSTIDELFIVDSSSFSEDVEVLFHFGEPLVVGITRFDEICRRIRTHRPNSLISLQTNGVLINNNWIEVFRKHRINVTVSVDFPLEMHGANRRSWSDRSSLNAVVSGLECLKQNNYFYSILSVLTREAIKSPEKIVEEVMRAGPKVWGLNIDEVEGLNKTTSWEPTHEEEFKRFFEKVLKSHQSLSATFKIREVDRFLKPENIRNRGNVTNSDYVSIDAYGKIYFLSPELCDLKSSKYQSFYFGKVGRDSVQSAFSRYIASDVYRDALVGEKMCETDCAHFDVCGSRFFANKVCENNTLASSNTLVCKLIIQCIADQLHFLSSGNNAR